MFVVNTAVSKIRPPCSGPDLRNYKYMFGETFYVERSLQRVCFVLFFQWQQLCVQMYSIPITDTTQRIEINIICLQTVSWFIYVCNMGKYRCLSL